MRAVRRQQERAVYSLRMMASLAFTLGLVVLVVRLWPAPDRTALPAAVYRSLSPEVIALEEVLPTRQARPAPPPPVPPLPVVVPDEVLLEEVNITADANRLLLEEAGTDPFAAEGALEGTLAAAPAFEVGPKPVRFVEPEYTRAARRARIRAEIVVEVQVSPTGQVLSATIVERYLLAPYRQRVDTLGYGLEEAALAAARRWRFRPARVNDQPVASFTRITFSFGQ
ncbi:energy transducer TonB [Rhodothermus profundi]|uniref:Outer membrane transport energization protein TonB n=1 Tax=Rhodothermus profundi TaxID=633813 RepID=A0A1M6PPW8_9BACT|nr:energy transducer TonB [Rhodothermus profundi]SHK09989.1 outer membrane transport energization protein TonB [Rhodothermus profundi]